MISVTVSRKGSVINGFRIEGHAFFDSPGKDIVCAAVSILTINTINAVEEFLPKEPFALVSDKEKGFLDFSFREKPSEKGKLLIDTYLLGIRGIEGQYGGRYLKLID